jgi:hypothetical protein
MTTPAPAAGHHYAAPDPDAVDAVAVLMREVAEGTLTGAAMADRATQRCAEVFAECDGPTDPLWPAHVEVCRAVLGFGGLPAAELSQWLAVARNRENPEGSTLYPPAPASPDSESYSHECDDVDEAAGPDPKPVAPEAGTVDATDTFDTLDDLPRDVLADAEAAAWAVIDCYRRQREAGDQ